MSNLFNLAEKQNKLGIKFATSRNFSKAIKYFNKAKEIYPLSPDTHYYLGLTYQQLKKDSQALVAYKKAINLKPDYAIAHNNLGTIYLGKNDFQKAAVHFKKAITGDPSNFPAYNNLANAYRQMGKVKEAIKYYLKAIGGNPNLPEPYNNLGRIYFEQGEFKKAASCFAKAIKINPHYASAYSNLGNAQMRLGKLDEAKSTLKHYLKLDPNNEEGYYLLGSIYSLLPKYHQAIKNYRKAIAINPWYAPAYNDLGNLYKKTHDFSRAVEYYEKAVGCDPKAAIAYCNLGISLSHLGKFDLAIQYLKKAIGIDPKYADAHYNLGVLYIKIERWDLAKESFQNTLKVNPQFSQALSLLTFALLQQCDWPKYLEVAPGLDRIILKELKDGLKTCETPLLNVIKCENQKINFEVAKSWGRSVEKNVIDARPNFYFTRKKGDKQLTVGYLSSDFYDHATAHLTLGMFKLHDRNKFKIYGYSYGMDDGSFYRKEIKRNCDKFVDLVNLGDIEIAKKIYKDRVDILVDLKGHTQNSRLEICALRPAPIQVTYLGFPGSTGSNFIDYLITDRVITPPGAEKYYSEKLVFLPNSYQVNNDRQKISEKKSTRGDFGLPDKAFVFCSFNQPNKIDPYGFSIWMKILKAVSKSVLWLLENNPFMEENLKREADKLGVFPSRLIFSPFLPKDEHLKRLTLSDLALDTFVCNGHTTTSDCLWAGVPVITLQGKHFASRVASSILTAVGLPELVTHSPKEYENLAVELAKDTKKLDAIRSKLNANRLTKPLFDTQKFVSNLEKAYIKMWENYLAGKNPSK